MLRFNTKVGGGKQSGFSLIELMVAVAIIGILAAIAIPNYQAFQRRARQVEARSVLSGIFTAEKSFIAEWGGGTTDLVGMGFYPEGQLGYLAGFSGDAIRDTALPACGGGNIPIRYRGGGLNLAQRHTGDGAGGICNTPGTLGGTRTCINVSAKAGPLDVTATAATGAPVGSIVHEDTTTFSPTIAATLPAAGAHTVIRAFCNSSRFQAIAIGNLGVVGPNAGETRDDVWTIDEDKVLTNRLSGV